MARQVDGTLLTYAGGSAAPHRELRWDRLRRSQRLSGVVFRIGVTAAPALVVVVLIAMVAFLVSKSLPAIRQYGLFTFLGSTKWTPSTAEASIHHPNPYGILQFVYGSVVTSVIAMILAVPVSVSVALFITNIAPYWARRPLSYIVDLLAAVPSVVFGFWGIFALIPRLQPIGNALTKSLGKLPGIGPAFAGPFYGVSYFTAGVVLAIMVLPIVTALCREIFATTPTAERDGALALGATRWEMLRLVVLPRSVPGIVGVSILGIGRALGETIAVTMVIGNSVLGINKSILAQGATMPSVIANEFTEATEPFHLSSLFVVAFWLLVLTVLVNVIGRVVIHRVGRLMGAM